MYLLRIYYTSSTTPSSGLYSNGKSKNDLHLHRTYNPEKGTDSKPKNKSLKLQILRSALKKIEGCERATQMDLLLIE